MNETNADLDGSVTSATTDSRLASSTTEHIYSNSHFKFEVLETTVWNWAFIIFVKCICVP